MNLFSVGKALKNGFTLSNEGVIITLHKSGTHVTFDRIFPTGKGFVTGVNLLPKIMHDENATIGLESKKVNVNMAHGFMTHVGEAYTRLTAKYYGLTVTGIMAPCHHCGLAKARQSNLSKTTDVKSQIKGERLYINLSWTNKPSYGGSKFWLLVMDDCTDFLWSYFLKEKSDLAKTIMNLLLDLKQKGIIVKYIRCDNAGEHLTLQQQCLQKGLGIEFEFTSRSTPQHNGKIERKFQTLFGRIRSMLNQAGIPEGMRQRTWAEAANTAVLWANAIITKAGTKPPYTLFHNKDADYVHNLHTFGEMGTSLDPTKKNVKAKLKNKGQLCMMLGPAVNHSKDTCRTLHINTKATVITRDVLWLNKTYGAYFHKVFQEFDINDLPDDFQGTSK